MKLTVTFKRQLKINLRKWPEKMLTKWENKQNLIQMNRIAVEVNGLWKKLFKWTVRSKALYAYFNKKIKKKMSTTLSSTSSCRVSFNEESLQQLPTQMQMPTQKGNSMKTCDGHNDGVDVVDVPDKFHKNVWRRWCCRLLLLLSLFLWMVGKWDAS